MKHFRIIAQLWLVFGTLGFLYTSWHASVMAGFIYRKEGLAALVVEVLGCLFTLAAAVAGYGLLRRWGWPRFAIEALAAILLACSLVALFFSEVVMSQRILVFVPASLFALYSLLGALFLSYERRPA